MEPKRLLFCVFGVFSNYFFAYIPYKTIPEEAPDFRTSPSKPQSNLVLLVKKGRHLSGGSLYSSVECDIETACLDKQKDEDRKVKDSALQKAHENCL